LEKHSQIIVKDHQSSAPPREPERKVTIFPIPQYRELTNADTDTLVRFIYSAQNKASEGTHLKGDVALSAIITRLIRINLSFHSAPI
jgi:hypothetical protein